MKKRWLTAALLILMVCCFAAPALAAEGDGTATVSASFYDVSPGDWYYDSVNFVVDAGLFQGTGGGAFSPYQTMTRGMFVTVMGRFAERYDDVTIEGFSHPFTDVDPNQYYSDYVAWAYNWDIVQGTTATTFGPDVSITREQMATLLMRFKWEMDYYFPAVDIYDLDGFYDAYAISDYARDNVASAKQYGFINGYEDGTFRPQNTADRAAVAKVFHNFAMAVTEPLLGALYINTNILNYFLESFDSMAAGGYYLVDTYQGTEIYEFPGIDDISFLYDMYDYTLLAMQMSPGTLFPNLEGETLMDLYNQYSDFEIYEDQGYTDEYGNPIVYGLFERGSHVYLFYPQNNDENAPIYFVQVSKRF